MNVQPPSASVQKLVSDLGAVRSRYAAVKSDLGAAQRDLSDGEDELRWARFPLQRAERDTRNTDVSFEGREIERRFRDTEREVSSGARDLRGATSDLDAIDQQVDAARQGLQALTAELSREPERYGPALGHLAEAARHLEGSDAGFTAGAGDADRALREAQGVERDLMFTSHLAREIAMDGPGRDVSSAAWRLSSQRDTMEWNLRSAERDVQRAEAGGDTGDRLAAQATEALQKALAVLD